MKAFLWHTLRGTMPNQCTIGSKRRRNNKLPIFGTEWPTYGFDEWFLVAVVYPRWAFEGVLTFHPINQREVNHWLALDIEYVTWANPKSEILFFGESDLINRKKIATASESLGSDILGRMLKEKQKDCCHTNGDCCHTGAISGHRRQEPATLVIARYKEELRWLLEVPDDVSIVVYNKGPEITDGDLLKRINHLIPLPNQGRESDTYLYHVQHFKHAADDCWTIFCQGDPFPHSPLFIRLIQQRDVWKDIQPLTSAYQHDGLSPPTLLRMLETDEWVRDIAVRSELLTCATLRMVLWHDPAGGRYIEKYSQHYRVPPGWSVTGHFLESCGLSDLAEMAWRATLVRGVYAAIFAVRNKQLATLPKKCLPRMRKLACEHSSVGYVYERLWLHLFGLPFIGIAALESHSTSVEEPHLCSKQ